MINENSLSIIAYILIGFLLGVIFATSNELKIVNELNVASFSNLLLIIILSILIPIYLTKRIDNVRSLKGLLMHSLNEYCNDIDNIDDLLSTKLNSKIDQEFCSKINYKFQSFGKRLSTISKQLNILADVEINDLFITVKTQHTGYWDSVTGENGIKPNKFDLNIEFLLEQKKLYDNLRENIGILKVKINMK